MRYDCSCSSCQPLGECGIYDLYYCTNEHGQHPMRYGTHVSVLRVRDNVYSIPLVDVPTLGDNIDYDRRVAFRKARKLAIERGYYYFPVEQEIGDALERLK